MTTDICFVCRKPLTGTVRYEVECYDGGASLVRVGQVLTEAEQDQSSYMGFYPVGADCARKLRQDGVRVEKMVMVN